MTCLSSKIDSNVVGLRFAEESCLGEIIGDAMHAVGAFHFDGTSDGADVTVTVGSREYTFVESDPGENEVLWEGDVTSLANAIIAAQNLAAAINGGLGAGTKYGSATVPHADVVARYVENGNGTSRPAVYVRAKEAGDAGNSIATTETTPGIAAEAATLLGGVDGDLPIWYDLEPSAWNDFGNEITTVSRDIFSPSRMSSKGTVVDENAQGGFTQDLTQNNSNRLLQSFFFANARELGTNKPTNDTEIDITGITTTYNASGGGLAARFAVGQLVWATDAALAANNGLKRLTGVADTALTTAETLAAETPPADFKLQVVGFQFASGDVAMSFTGGVCKLTSAGGNFANRTELIPGMWIAIGGQAAATRFANNVGYACIYSRSSTELVLTETTFAPVTEAGTGKTIQIFIPTMLKNESESLIVYKPVTLEQSLGPSKYDAAYPQAVYLSGSVANEFTLNIPQTDKVSLEMSFVAKSFFEKTGSPWEETLSSLGVRIAAEKENAINTSSDGYIQRMTVSDPTNPFANSLFGFVSEASLTVNNNVSANKAVFVRGGTFALTAGKFEVTGSITPYFTDVEAIRAIRKNADVGYYNIIAVRNFAMIWHMPLIGLAGGGLDIEQDSAVMVNLESTAYESKYGHVLSYCYFPYVPDVHMAQAA